MRNFFFSLIALIFLIQINLAFAQTAAQTFPDVLTNHKNQVAIEYLKQKGVIQGYPDGTFQPGKSVNRAEILKILIEGRHLTPDANLYKNCFPDVHEEWFAKYVCYAESQGWVQGYPSGNFEPARPVNKVEAIKMAIEVHAMQAELPATLDVNPYLDTNKTAWYTPYLKLAQDKGLLEETGYTFEPANDMQRGGMSEIIYRVMKITAEDLAKFTAPTDGYLVSEISIVQKDAAHSEWSSSGDLIVFDKEGADEYHDLYIMQEDGEITQSLTAENPKINQRHNGWPAWHPDDEYIVFQSEEAEHYGVESKWMGFPGLGFFSNLWATTPEANQFWKLTDIEIKQTAFDEIPIKGIISSNFSHDGKKLMWTERYASGGYLEWGKWQIKMADFVIDADSPRLENVETILRAEDVCEKCNYVVGMAFSPDDKTLLISGNLDGQHVYGMDQYSYDLETGEFTNLQNTPYFWEEGGCWSPDGQKIIFPTNFHSAYKLDFTNPGWPTQPRTREYWIMDADGSNKRPLTHFNIPGSTEYLEIGQGQRMIAAECAFHPDGKKIFGIIGIDERDDDQAQIQINIGSIEFK